jgi:hypothetical protein
MHAIASSVLATLLLSGCSSDPGCADLGAPTGLATNAAVLRLQVYGPGARCDANRVVATAPPIRVVDISPVHPGPVDLPPGAIVAYLAAYGDAAATMLIGEGCSETTIRSGETACLSVPLSAPNPANCTPVQHSNGLGKTYSDCAAIGAGVDARLAGLACAASFSDASQCKDMACSGGSGGRAVCDHAANCVCWTYSGAGAGFVHSSQGGGCDCATAGSGDPSWN